MSQVILGTMGRTLLGYLLVLLLVRLMGRKTISQMTFFNFVVAITIGSLTASFAMGSNNSSLSAGVALVTFTVFVIALGYLHIKSFDVRKLINSEPVTLIKNGKIVYENMKKTRTGLDDLNSLLRKKNIFNIADVEFAIMENDGKLSVLPKSQKQPLTPSDINLFPPYKGLTHDIILDGQLMEENLQDTGLKIHDVVNLLNSQGISDMNDVFYAGLDSSKQLYISRKEKKVEKSGEYGIE